MSTPILTCTNLNKSYTSGKPVLHNLNISLSGGKIVGLLGPNGCGKSTLLKLISGILVPDSGSIEICGILGIPHTVVHAGHAKGISKEEYFERNLAFYRQLFPVMEATGVSVLVENSTKANMGDQYYVNSGADLAEFLRYAGHPLLHACWDTGHANCEGSQYDEIMALGDELRGVHINDNRGGGDEHIAPFLGTLNHDEVISALIDVGFKGCFTLECMSSLRPYNCWQGVRVRFEKSALLREPQLFMQRHIEKMMYETSEWMLKGTDVTSNGTSSSCRW
jgi:sugar phosphate isomerase/epimerase